jgi:hypothetical protein
LAHGLAHEADEEADLVVRTLPVLGREREKSQIFDPVVSKAGYGPPNVFDACSVPFASMHASFVAPPTIAIHDDGHMLWGLQLFGDSG